MTTETLLASGFAFERLVMLAVTVVAVAGGILLATRRARRDVEPRHAVARTILDIGLLLSIAAILVATIVPDPSHGPGAPGIDGRMNLEPLATVNSMLRWGSPFEQFNNLVLNIVLFVPFGFAVALKARGTLPILGATVAGVLLSVGVETVQLMLPLGRALDVDDILLNGIGALLGALLAKAMTPLFRRWAHTRGLVPPEDDPIDLAWDDDLDHVAG